MFVNVGRFHLRPMDESVRQRLMRSIEENLAPTVRKSPGFRGVYFARPSELEIFAVSFWDSEGDWQSALTHLAPYLQQHVIPHLERPPDRLAGDIVTQVMP